MRLQQQASSCKTPRYFNATTQPECSAMSKKRLKKSKHLTKSISCKCFELQGKTHIQASAGDSAWCSVCYSHSQSQGQKPSGRWIRWAWRGTARLLSCSLKMTSFSEAPTDRVFIHHLPPNLVYRPSLTQMMKWCGTAEESRNTLYLDVVMRRNNAKHDLIFHLKIFLKNGTRRTSS